MRRSISAAVLATGLLAGCASQGEMERGEVYAPIEPANRLVFAVNETVDTFILQPTAYVYRGTVPDPVRDMVRNFLGWLQSPVILANDLMQVEWKAAETTVSRFVANAPFFGFIDNASGLGLEYRDEDFGQTLATYGVGDGPYIVLPLLGPSNARDVVGRVVDNFLDPINYAKGGHPLDTDDDVDTFQMGRWIVGAVEFRARNFEAINELKETSVDYYARVRTIYKQRREALIENGSPPAGASGTGSSGEFDQYVPGGQPAERRRTATPSS